MEDRPRQLRPLLWCALAASLLGQLGGLWDRSWHARQSGEFGGLAHVLQAHGIMIVAAAAAFAFLLAAIRRSGGESRSVRAVVGVALLAATTDLAANLWDNALHIQMSHSVAAHILSTFGWLTVLVLVPTALIITRPRRIAATDSVASGTRSSQ